MHIKKGDTVVVLSGDEKGKKGKVTKMIPVDGLAIVEGVNIKKRHQRARQQGKSGQVVEVTMPIRVSKLALADKSKKK